MQTGRMKSIDGLKGIACLIIVFYHYSSYFDSIGLWIFGHGEVMVEVFFAISGFMMAYNYKLRLSKMDFTSFFVKRYMKIMPLYWVTNGAFYLMLLLGGIIAGKNLFFDYKLSLVSVLMEFSGFYTGWLYGDMPMNIPLWTVCIMLLCYIIYYIMCKVSKKSQNRYILCVIFLIGFSILGNTVTKSDEFVPLYNGAVFRGLESFGVGLFLYELYNRLSAKGGLLISIGGIIATAVVCFMTVCLGVKDLSLFSEQRFLAFLLFFTPAFILSSIYVPPINWILSSKPFQFLGKMSMGLYMWHYLIRILIGGRPFYLNGTFKGLVVILVGTFIISIFSYYFIEPLFNKILSKMNKSLIK